MRVKPRASRDGLDGEREGALVVRLQAPPVDGEANAALSRLLGKTLGVPPSRVAVVRGGTAREKLVRVDGVSRELALQALGAA